MKICIIRDDKSQVGFSIKVEQVSFKLYPCKGGNFSAFQGGRKVYDTEASDVVSAITETYNAIK